MAGHLMRAEFIAHVTGESSPNRTGSRAGVYGTDLGIMWPSGHGDVLVAFGDTYGAEWGGSGAGPESADWRKNVLARTPVTPPVTGLEFTRWIEDRPGHARQVLADDTTVQEETVIPTAGIEHDGVQYIHAMSVRKWGKPGQWTTNYAALWSSPDGQSWAKSGPRWDHPGRWWQRRRPDGSRFQMGAFVHHGDHVLLFGTPSGRQGSAYLARSRDMRLWEYWTGDWWQSDPGMTHPVMAGPTAELSVIWHESSKQWLALTLTGPAIVLRTAPEPTGPWTAGVPVITARDVPGLYGGYFHPASASGDLYLNISQWRSYNVMLYRIPVTQGLGIVDDGEPTLLKRLMRSEDQPARRPVIVRVSRKLSPDERTVARAISPPGFLNIIGADDEGATEGVAAPVGAPATYEVELTDAEIEQYRQASNCEDIEEVEVHRAQLLEVEPVDGALAAAADIPEPAVLAWMGAGTSRLDGAGVRVAVLDGGISPQVRLRMGYRVVAERNFSGVPTGSDGYTTDHGCMVAPLCVPPGAEVIDLIVGDDGGSSRSSWYAAAVRYAVDNGAKVINYSYGGGASGGVHRDAARYARANGAIILCSAGNSARPNLDSPSDLCREFPDTVVSSIAFDHLTGLRASFSCHHADGTLCAPGKRVLSLSAAGRPIRVSGTSFSCPLTAFVLAVALAYVKGRFTAPEVLKVLRDTARNTPAPKNEEGGGAPDLQATLDKLRPANSPTPAPAPLPPAEPPEPPVKPLEPGWLRKLRVRLAMYAVASDTPPWLSRLIRKILGS